MTVLFYIGFCVILVLPFVASALTSHAGIKEIIIAVIAGIIVIHVLGLLLMWV